MESADQVLRRVEEFFMKKDAVHEALRRLSTRLPAEQIDYAVIDGMALALHNLVRTTDDVDLLLTPEGLERFHERLAGRGYTPTFPGARKSFRDVETGVTIEIITTGEYPGDGKPKPVSFPDPGESSTDREGYRVIRLEKLIELKLASGMTAPHRLRDLADVQDLITTLGLTLEFGDGLDPSVREEYRRLWRAAAQSAPA